MGALPRVQFTSSDDPGTATAATPAVPIQDTTSGTATQYAAERTRVRLPEAEAEEAPPVQKDKKRLKRLLRPQTTSSARALVKRVGHEAGEDSQLVQMRRIAALMAECEDVDASDDIAEARRAHLEKLTNVKDSTIKVVPRTDATTRPCQVARWTPCTTMERGKPGGRRVGTSNS